ncbi:hypothetical protein Chor_002004, partial [Crotalus horridus]
LCLGCVSCRIAEFEDILNEPNIVLQKLRKFCFNGIPFEGGLRCLCWKILLNYLPVERCAWNSQLKKQRELYAQFLKEMIIQPGITKAELGVFREDVTLEDHPLNPNPNSQWNTYFKDNEVLLQIDKDVRRLYPDMAFFQRPTEYPCLLILDPQNEFETLRKRVEQTTLKSQTVARNRSGVTNVRGYSSLFLKISSDGAPTISGGKPFHWLIVLLVRNFLLSSRLLLSLISFQPLFPVLPSGALVMLGPHFFLTLQVSSPLKAPVLNEHEVLPDGSEAHWEVVERILFIYAKLNPGIAYVQGMNEIVGPLYYTFATDPNSEWKKHAEADTFFCFTNLMSEIRDNFIKSLDDSQCGITCKMEKVYVILKEKDGELYLKLQEQNIKPQFFAFRWLTLLLSQEFLLPDVIRIWDSLFADDNRFDFLLLVCCAMLTLIRDQLLEGDFTVNMRHLQDYPISDVHLILKTAKDLQGSKQM